MSTDTELLHQYARERSEAAFAELVRRHIDFVYATALRQVGGDAHHAADVGQFVFTEVTRKAGTLAKYRALKGWLYTTTRNAAANIVRAERRRQVHELEAHTMQELLHHTPTSNSDELKPVIDKALGALSERDREAVFLRFFEGRDYPEIGARFSVSGDAARLRIERALEKMRMTLSRQGIASTTAALMGTLTTQAAVMAPAGLAGSVTGAALTAAAVGGGAFTLFTLMSMTKVQVGTIGGLILAGTLGVVFQQQAHARLRDRLVSVRQQVREVARLRVENARLAQPGITFDDGGRDELLKLREETEGLKKQIAAASKIPLARGMIPSSQWKNIGRATPGAALETLLWAAENGDIQTVGKMVGFDPLVRVEADAIFPHMPEALRKAGDVTSVEEMVGLAWTIGAQLVGSEMVGTLGQYASESPDSVTIVVRFQKTDGAVYTEQIPFHRTPDGWQWVLSHKNLDFVGKGIGNYTKHILDKK